MSGVSSTISGSMSNNMSSPSINGIEQSINSSLKNSKSGRTIDKATQLNLTVKLDGKKIPNYSDTEIRNSKSSFNNNDDDEMVIFKSIRPPAIPDLPQDESESPTTTNSESGSGRRFQNLFSNAKRQEDQILLLNSSYLNCPICHETFVEASSLGCGHTFCKNCIVEWLKRKKICPLCGLADKGEYSRVYLIDKIIEDHISNFPQTTKAQIELASKSRQEMYLKRILDQKNPSIIRRKLNSIQDLKYVWDTKGLSGIGFKCRRFWHNFNFFTSSTSENSKRTTNTTPSSPTDEPNNKFSFKSFGFICLMLFIGFLLGILYCQFDVIQHFLNYIMNYKLPVGKSSDHCEHHETQRECRDKSSWFDWWF